MANAKTKGINYTVGFIADGVQQPGSFAKVENLKITPDAEIKKADFLGEGESEGDMMHHGFDFSFTIAEADARASSWYTTMAAASAEGATLPRVDVIVITTFVDPNVLTRTQVLGEAVAKIDSHDIGGRKDYVKISVSGFAKTMRTL